MTPAAPCRMLGIALPALALSAMAAPSALTPTGLRCEYRANPLGVDAAAPRLGWVLDSPVRGDRQTAYQVLVASTEEALRAGRGDLWDSGKVGSPETFHIPYRGKPLSSWSQCFWKVQVWNRRGIPSPWSEVASWTMGVLSPSDWKAQWIGRTQSLTDPPPLLRREFRIDRPVRRALLQIAGLGQHEAFVNGRKAGDHVLDPGWTDYRKTVLYASHDVTRDLRPGANAIGISLGNGFYNVAGGRYVKYKGSFGTPRALAQLHIEFSDGSSTEIATGPEWKASAGPIVFSCVYGGEDYDARREMAGWSAPGFDDSTWQPARVVEPPGGRLTAQSAPPVKVMKVYQPVNIAEPAPDVLVYDLGQNFSGWPEITVEGPAGSTVKLIPGESLDAKGLVSQRSSGSPVWFAYTLKGKGRETWRPAFSYYGFRYVQVEVATRSTAAGKPRMLALSGQFLHSSATVAGSFETSNPLLNRIHRLILAAMRSNLQSVLTDCPHREKLGWLEVAHLLGPSLMFNFDLQGLVAKISHDAAEAQTADGLIPDIAPEYVKFSGGFRDSPEWGSAGVILPWLAYRWYADLDLPRELYPAMARYLGYLASKSKEGLLVHGLGDWCDVGSGRTCRSRDTPEGVTATSIYHEDLRIAYQVASWLGKTDDARRHRERAAQAAAAFHARFFDAARRWYGSGSQTANAMPLVSGITPPELRARAIEVLVNDVRTRGNHASGGDVGHPYLIRALLEAGRSDVLFDAIANKQAPSYAAQLEAGATALAESWDGNPALSLNHCMLGHAEEWFYRGPAGFFSFSPGFAEVALRLRTPDGIDWVEAHYDSVRGRLGSAWRFSGKDLHWRIRIPPGVTATVAIPARSASAVTEGGVPAAKAPGLRPAGQQGCVAVYHAESGAYEFVSAGAPRCY